jgi:hypothetical protein
MTAPKRPGLPDKASIADLLPSAAVPGRDGVTLTDKPDDPSALFGAMGQLTEKTGIGTRWCATMAKRPACPGPPGRRTVPAVKTHVCMPAARVRRLSRGPELW